MYKRLRRGAVIWELGTYWQAVKYSFVWELQVLPLYNDITVTSTKTSAEGRKTFKWFEWLKKSFLFFDLLAATQRSTFHILVDNELHCTFSHSFHFRNHYPTSPYQPIFPKLAISVHLFLDPWLVPNATQSHLISSVSTDPAGKCHTVTGTKPGHHNHTLRGPGAVTSSQVHRLLSGW